MSADNIAAALNGIKAGAGYMCRCPVPSHGKRRGDLNRSLSIQDGNRRGRVLFHCFAGCDSRDVLNALRARGLIDRTHSSGDFQRRPGLAPAAVARHQQASDSRAVRLWQMAKPAGGTVVERYLRRRGIDTAPPPSLRLHVSQDGAPSMIAAVQAPNGNIAAVQVTALTRDGKKAAVANPRITMGALGGGAVRLAPTGDVLGLAEGTETALAATQLTGVPCWAVLGAGRMHQVMISGGVRQLHIFADDDEPGRKAAERTAEHHAKQGRRVVLRFPPIGHNDWADLLEARTNLEKAA